MSLQQPKVFMYRNTGLTSHSQETFPVIISGYKLWPMVSFLSFTFVPVDRRVVFFSAFGLGWNIYMSLVAAAV